VRLLARTLILELRLASLRGALPGETPRLRFDDFTSWLGTDDGRRELLGRYPVLGRLLAVRVGYWLEHATEVLTRLCRDRTAIAQTFLDGRPPGRLVAVGGPLGDSHRQGRAVLALTFDSGFRLIYKPRSLAVDEHLAAFLDWVQARGWDPPLKMPRTLAGDGYGWNEFVEHRPCQSAAEVARFQQRLGGYLALLHVLEGMDFHAENLIAWGEHPALLDLEALLQPRYPAPEPENAAGHAARARLGSVLRVGFLPQSIWAVDEDRGGIDISAIGGAPGQLTPFEVPQYARLATDELRIERRRMPLAGQANQPALADGTPVAAADQVAELTGGFTRMYRLLMEHRDELLSGDGPLERFREDEVRVLLRETRTYGVLVYEASHPDVLRDALDRDQLLDHLWIEAPVRPELERLVPHEREDIEGGDIPIFTTRPGRLDLWTSAGRRVPGVFAVSGLDCVRDHVRALGPEDLERQRWIIRASLTGDSVMARPARAAGTGDPASPPVSPQRLLDGACLVGERIGQLAIRGARDATWLGIQPAQSRSTVGVAGPDLYDGTAGIAVFLACLAEVTGQATHLDLALAAGRSAREQLAAAPRGRIGLGGFGGWGGEIYRCALMAGVGDQTSLWTYAEETAARLDDELIAADGQFDIIAGAAGCIGALLAAHAMHGSSAFLGAAQRCGDHLVGHARPLDGDRLGWLNPAFGPRPLTGFSHGVAGIAWALGRLWQATGAARYAETAAGALRYERSLFLPSRDNWPDLRDNLPAHDEPVCMTAWCHGAPGIGLSRLGLADDLTDPAEVQAAVTATVAEGLDGSDCLCHGVAGNIDFLAAAARANGEGPSPVIDTAVASLLTRVDNGRCRSGSPSGVETPGLMTGLAGIGYQLLRLGNPSRIPSVLLLEPAPAA
jgi:class II lanthipeptide synthase